MTNKNQVERVNKMQNKSKSMKTTMNKNQKHTDGSHDETLEEEADGHKDYIHGHTDDRWSEEGKDR